jgi:predicted TIM-barrel fold metal-dependent hydrolase
MSEFDSSRSLTRREMLARSGSALAGLGAVASFAPGLVMAQKSADQKPGGYIDAHVHVWTPDVKKYPLAEGFRPADMQPPSFTPEELLAHAGPCGVGRITLIQMSFYKYDNSYMLDVIKAHPGVFSGVAIVDHTKPKVDAEMKSLAKRGVRGFRLAPGKESTEKYFASKGMETMWRTGAKENLKMCLLINPEALPTVDKLCEKNPDTPVVIDHFARIGVDGKIGESDLANLCRLARHKNTFVKVSAFYALGKKMTPYVDLLPMIRLLHETFGSQRLMWASDCPFQVQGDHNYRDSVDLIAKRADFLSADDRKQILGGTAERVFFA